MGGQHQGAVTPRLQRLLESRKDQRDLENECRKLLVAAPTPLPLGHRIGEGEVFSALSQAKLLVAELEPAKEGSLKISWQG
ncbi:hypothetical protein PoB_001005600 [Plakobranchus ocellatus]|uniref:Uncharacterized protein n=1 Tax=Plakobranchus ocellatus TaxID=259542 RepID=A0AAV3YJX0_9GAST|nr:hypothetical protein PoB_001005600 [Plakobranchus ocellatus]